MKKLFLTVIAIAAICNVSNARSYRSSKDAPNVAFSAGWTATSKTNIIRSSSDARNQLLNGWFLSADFTFRELLGPVNLTPGIRFQQNFSKKEKLEIGKYGEYSEQLIIADIQVPVDFSWGYDFNGIVPFVFAGPTFNFGITSRTVKQFNEGYKEEDMHYRRDTDYRPFNIFVGGGIGCRYKCIRIAARYDYGLINRWKGNTAKEERMTDSQITVGVAYCF